MVRFLSLIIVASGISLLNYLAAYAGGNKQPIVVPVTYDDHIVVVSNPSGVTAIQFHDEWNKQSKKLFDRGVCYKFRYFRKRDGKEFDGRGKVCEKFQQTANSKKDLGSQRFIRIRTGKLSLQWSFLKKKQGAVLHLPEKMKMCIIGVPSDFRKVDLLRFR